MVFNVKTTTTTQQQENKTNEVYVVCDMSYLFSQRSSEGQVCRICD